MVCFIETTISDFLLYHPIKITLEKRKIEFTSISLDDMSNEEILNHLVNTPNINTYIIHGFSKNKSLLSLMCGDYGKRTIVLYGNERNGDIRDDSFVDVINATGWSHFVSGDPARTFLLEKHIQTHIGFFECPITHLCRKSQNVEPFDILYISGDPVNIDRHERELIRHKYKYKVFDLSNGLPRNWNEIYSYLRTTKYIVSDLFIFDRPSRNLNKHFFYFGGDVLDTQNLGISTHIMSKKLELHDYLKQSWRPLQDVNPKWGLEPLMNLL